MILVTKCSPDFIDSRVLCCYRVIGEDDESSNDVLPAETPVERYGGGMARVRMTTVINCRSDSMMLERANMVMNGAMVRGPAGRYTFRPHIHVLLVPTFHSTSGLERLLRCKSGVDLDS